MRHLHRNDGATFHNTALGDPLCSGQMAVGYFANAGPPSSGIRQGLVAEIGVCFRMVKKPKCSTYELIGLPSHFANFLLIFCFLLSVSPYLAGSDFGIFQVPEFDASTKQILKVLGPVAFVLTVFLFIPIWRGSIDKVEPYVNGSSPSKTVETPPIELLQPNSAKIEGIPAVQVEGDFIGVTSLSRFHAVAKSTGLLEHIADDETVKIISYPSLLSVSILPKSKPPSGGNITLGFGESADIQFKDDVYAVGIMFKQGLYPALFVFYLSNGEMKTLHNTRTYYPDTGFVGYYALAPIQRLIIQSQGHGTVQVKTVYFYTTKYHERHFP